MSHEMVIVPVTAQKAKFEQIKKVVVLRTGDQYPFFCPPVREGEFYNGHAHVFPPCSIDTSSIGPIKIRQKY